MADQGTRDHDRPSTLANPRRVRAAALQEAARDSRRSAEPAAQLPAAQLPATRLAATQLPGSWPPGARHAEP